MLKQKLNFQKPIFRKKKTKYFQKKPLKNQIYFKKMKLINLIKVFKWLKLTYRRFKKKNINLRINIKKNLIRTFKSKNARMGKGKGQLKRYTSLHFSVIFGLQKNNSPCRLIKLKKALLYLLK